MGSNLFLVSRQCHDSCLCLHQDTTFFGLVDAEGYSWFGFEPNHLEKDQHAVLSSLWGWMVLATVWHCADSSNLRPLVLGSHRPDLGCPSVLSITSFLCDCRNFLLHYPHGWNMKCKLRHTNIVRPGREADEISLLEKGHRTDGGSDHFFPYKESYTILVFSFSHTLPETVASIYWSFDKVPAIWPLPDPQCPTGIILAHVRVPSTLHWLNVWMYHVPKDILLKSMVGSIAHFSLLLLWNLSEGHAVIYASWNCKEFVSFF